MAYCAWRQPLAPSHGDKAAICCRSILNLITFFDARVIPRRT
jgi:hypothetical protein